MSEQEQTLLIVDDEANVLKSIRRLLFETDYRVLTAESGLEGLEVFEREPSIQLVISDYRMPEMNGVEFLHQVKQLYPSTVRMILSGYADVMAIVETINDGKGYRFISKPWNDQDLLTTIMRAFEQYSAGRDNDQLTEQLLEQNKRPEEAAALLAEKSQKKTWPLGSKIRALSMFHRTLDLLPAGVVSIDSDGTVVYSNEKARKYLGAGKLNLQEAADRAFQPDVLSNIMATISSHQDYRDTIQGNCKLGLIAEPLPHGAGVICILLDVEGAGFESGQSKISVTKGESTGV